MCFNADVATLAQLNTPTKRNVETLSENLRPDGFIFLAFAALKHCLTDSGALWDDSSRTETKDLILQHPGWSRVVGLAFGS